MDLLSAWRPKAVVHLGRGCCLRVQKLTPWWPGDASGCGGMPSQHGRPIQRPALWRDRQRPGTALPCGALNHIGSKINWQNEHHKINNIIREKLGKREKTQRVVLGLLG